MVFAHCCVGAPTKVSGCVNSRLREDLGAEVCHEDDDARELGDFRQTAKLVEKTEASGHLWTVRLQVVLKSKFGCHGPSADLVLA